MLALIKGDSMDSLWAVSVIKYILAFLILVSISKKNPFKKSQLESSFT